jgi:tetratricopeptide (TPR) repeat protein
MLLTWQQTEFLLKGVYLGLLVMIACMVPAPTALELTLIALYTAVGLLAFLAVAGYRKIREGYRVRGRWVGFIVFLLLENPGMVYAGMLVGLSGGIMLTFNRREVADDAVAIPLDAIWPVLGGAALGGIFYALRNMRQPMYRFWISFGMAGVLVAGAVALFHFEPERFQPDKQTMIGWLLLFGIPGFYLLTFAGLVEESEIEVGAMCAALGISLWALLSNFSRPVMGGVVVILPAGLFLVYTTRMMPALRVFKHALRGLSYRHMGQTRLALISLGRALQLDPNNPLARTQMWDIHRDLDFGELKNQPDVVPFLNFGFCLERVNQILQTRPSPEQARDVMKMLDLIAEERPPLAPICSYWRAVAYLHEHQFDEAAKQLISILQFPQYLTRERQSIHYAAWQLALRGHPEMARRVGEVVLPLPGEHMDAIAAVESQLGLTPQDPTALDLKKQLYQELTEAEYWSITKPEQPPTHFDFAFAQDLGMALLPNPEQWQRGCEYLRMAAHGLPLQAANIYMHIAHTHDKHGDRAGLWANYLKAMQIGRSVGVQNFSPADKEALFINVKKVGELAIKEKQIDVALEAYKFLSLHENAGIETWRILAQLFEQMAERCRQANNDAARVKNLWQALHCTEHAMTHNANDPDLIARKDRYYYSIMPEDLRASLESVKNWFDPDYCKTKASWILERHNNDPGNIDWAAHLAELAIVAQPGSLQARFLKARLHRLKGELADMTAVLELIRQNKPEKFANEDEAKSWYYTHKLLGDSYLETQPDQAILCYQEFRQSDDAGADTSYKLGRAYEAVGDFRNAAACYDEVTAYERHPLFYEARDALARVRGGAAAR